MLVMRKLTISTGPFSSSQTVNVYQRGIPAVMEYPHLWDEIWDLYGSICLPEGKLKVFTSHFQGKFRVNAMKFMVSQPWSVMVATKPSKSSARQQHFLSNAGGLILLVRTYVMNDVTLWLFNIAMV